MCSISLGGDMTARKSLISQINKMLNKDAVDYPKINALFMKGVLIDPAVWTPLYQAFLTKREPAKSGAIEPEVHVGVFG
jgi:hypothetical protein